MPPPIDYQKLFAGTSAKPVGPEEAARMNTLKAPAVHTEVHSPLGDYIGARSQGDIEEIIGNSTVNQPDLFENERGASRFGKPAGPGGSLANKFTAHEIEFDYLNKKVITTKEELLEKIAKEANLENLKKHVWKASSRVAGPLSAAYSGIDWWWENILKPTMAGGIPGSIFH